MIISYTVYPLLDPSFKRCWVPDKNIRFHMQTKRLMSPNISAGIITPISATNVIHKNPSRITFKIFGGTSISIYTDIILLVVRWGGGVKLWMTQFWKW